MVDIMSAVERSQRMSLIRSKDTGPELTLRRALHARGLRYRIHVKELPGKPDLVFGRARAVVFVNGCFWHGHKCPTGHIPKTNTQFWRTKILTNRSRDARNIRRLRREGWHVIVVWECALRNDVLVRLAAEKLDEKLRKLRGCDTFREYKTRPLK
jgi:DNA mismatch endonuclease (patch repair protein)